MHGLAKITSLSYFRADLPNHSRKRLTDAQRLANDWRRYIYMMRKSEYKSFDVGIMVEDGNMRKKRGTKMNKCEEVATYTSSSAFHLQPISSPSGSPGPPWASCCSIARIEVDG